MLAAFEMYEIENDRTIYVIAKTTFYMEWN